ncbi:MAG: hypothetical protein ACU841_04030 [Gammaproteobacteria bacterium]
MPNPIKPERLKSDLTVPWIFVAIIVVSQMAYLVFGHFYGNQFQLHLPDLQREWIRSVFYAVAIILFPLTNLIRHVMVRLNQTMPGDKPPKQRYLTTILVTLLLMESVGIMGLVIFLLGDDFNTLYIFSVLVFLGLYLYRPKLDEYSRIVEALSVKSDG